MLPSSVQFSFAALATLPMYLEIKNNLDPIYAINIDGVEFVGSKDTGGIRMLMARQIYEAFARHNDAESEEDRQKIGEVCVSTAHRLTQINRSGSGYYIGLDGTGMRIESDGDFLDDLA